MRSFFLLFSMLLVMDPSSVVAGPVTPGHPHRTGLTFDVSSGGGFLHAFDHTGAAIALQLQVGCYLTSDTAISLRAISLGEPYEDDEGDSSGMGFLGPSLQHWLTDRVFVSAGIGLYGVSRGDDRVGSSENGVGVDGRVGYAFWASELSALYVAVGGSGGHDDEVRAAVSAHLGWHVF